MNTTLKNFAPKSVAELLDRWDNDEQVQSISLGGIGPGYEQAIQETAIEFARAGLEKEEVNILRGILTRVDELVARGPRP